MVDTKEKQNNNNVKGVPAGMETVAAELPRIGVARGGPEGLAPPVNEKKYQS